ncbi:MAG TPA: valine--tRNA ligase [Urbifossiella sp.]|nr:valine--tRNA ligase [Urbifossiella sp.]
MPTELPKAYDPKDAQQKWLRVWDERGYFHSEPDPARKPFTIVIPPPNVTGALHMGHALNNTLQDVLIRWRRMQGFNALWMPGTDHAGIATQSVVEKRLLAEEKKTRDDLGREELVRRIWEWKDRYEARILGQLKSIGASCDWQRTRFTLDPVCARAVRETFFRMFRDGYIYRGKRLVNWDAQLQTSVADDETENVKQKGKFYYFRYPVSSGPADGLDHVLIATTRPETMLGDTAVAVHPEPRRELDKRENELRDELAKASKEAKPSEKETKELRDRLERLSKRRDEMLPQLERLAAMAMAGATLELPLVGRIIPLIADRYADPEKGTGAVKITPAHDFNDYDVWQRHPEIGQPLNILNPDGSINDTGRGSYRGREYAYAGLDRFKAREKVVQDLTELGLFEKDEEIENSIPISDRSKTPIEPYLSDQWFVKMADRDDGKPGLAQMAMDAVTSGRVKFFPDRYAKTYLDWLAEKRDWCISRQLWWGHRIPVWTLPCPTKSEADALLSQIKSHTSISAALSGGRVEISLQSYGDGYETVLQGNPTLLRPTNFIHVCVRDNEPTLVGDLQQFQTSRGIQFQQSEDVLDTWFSSALWPHSTLGWPESTPELKYYYPTSVLVTSRDIISLWVARMVLTGLYNLDEIPFHQVVIHPQLQDAFGERMSKTTGNGIDPLDIVDRYGADSLRFQMSFIAGDTQDSRMPVSNVCPACDTLVPIKQEHLRGRTRKVVCPNCKVPFRPGGPWTSEDPELKTAKQASERFDTGRNFANKLWNATRFLLMNLEGYTPAPVDVAALPTEDRWLLSRLATTATEVTTALEGFKFSEVARGLYEFVWSEFCDWYIEMAKGRLKDAAARPVAQRVLVGVLDGILRLVHPVMPFVSESLWEALNEAAPQRGLLQTETSAANACIATWPSYPAAWVDAGVESRFARMQELVRGVREVRNRYQVDDKTRLDVSVKAGEAVSADFTALATFIGPLAGIANFTASPTAAKPKQAGSVVRPEFEAYVALAGLIDPAAEAKRLEKQLADKRKQLDGVKAKLANEKFVASAPAEVVQQQRDLVTDLEGQIRATEENLKDLQEG